MNSWGGTMTVRTIQGRLLKMLRRKAEGIDYLHEWQRREKWDVSASLSSLSAELCILKEACEAAGIDEWRIYEASHLTKAASPK